MPRQAGSAKLLRALNSSATLAHLLQSGQLTRAELRERTGLSKPTSSEMLRLLTHAGLAVVAGRTAGAPGPTAEIYAPNADAAYTVALSVRDTTEQDRPDLAVALCDLNGTVRDRAERRVDFAAESPADVVAGEVVAACHRAGVDAARVRHVQIGVAGSYDPGTGTIRYIDVPQWDGRGVLDDVRAKLAVALGVADLAVPNPRVPDPRVPDPRGSDPRVPDPRGSDGLCVALDNDVNLAAIAERHRGVAAGAESFALLWLGHGLGLALDLGGTLLRGARGGAGEIGYLPLHFNPERCPGGPPDLQRLVGGPAVMRLAATHDIRARTASEAVTIALSRGHDDVLTELARRIAFAVAAVTAVLDPPLVVLAGEVAQAGGARLRDAVAAALYPTAQQSEPVSVGEVVHVAITAVEDDAVLLGGLDAGLHALRESLISSLAHPSSLD